MSRQRKSIVDAAPGSRPSLVDDAELLDALERYIKREPLVLWFGHGVFPAPGSGLWGLSLMGGQRSLRDALKGLIPAPNQRPAEPGAATKENET